jgi:ribosome-associated translation inhibitor RaiA
MKAAIDELSDKLVRQVGDRHDKRVSTRKHADDVELTEPPELPES